MTFMQLAVLNWLEKLAEMPATISNSRLPRKLLGAWCFGGKRVPGHPRQTTRRAYLNLVKTLKFDDLDCISLATKKAVKAKKANYVVYLI